jgi:hypothetical protein
LGEWRATWFWLGQVSAIEKEAKPSLESLEQLALGSHLVQVDAARLYDWTTELGGRELGLLNFAADQCRFVANLGRLLERRIDELMVPGKVHNINEPRNVARAMRAIILRSEDEFASNVGPTVAQNALSNAQQLISDSVIQEYLPRYEIAVPRMYESVAQWSSVHFQEMLDVASRATPTS